MGTKRTNKSGKQTHAKRDAEKMLNGRSLLLGGYAQAHTTDFDAKAFDAYVKETVEYGATHVYVGWLPFKYGDWFLPDNVDPYACWSTVGFCLLRLFPPKALQPWVKLSDAKPYQKIIEAQVKTLRKYGLKGSISACEPQWLPEGVYEAHPHWRGPQCELGRIARRPYFTPSIDEPEVLELYSDAMHEIARRFPEIEMFSFMSNDSGAGISWSPCLYPGMNGPTAWRTRDPGERIAGWLQAMQAGSKKGGVASKVHVHSSGLPVGTVASTLAKLGKDQFINWQGDGNMFGPAAGLTSGLWCQRYPVVGLGNPIDFVKGLQQVYNNPGKDTATASLNYEEHDAPTAKLALESYFEAPGKGLLNQTTTLLRMAEKMTGSEEDAEELVDIWRAMQDADLSMTKIPQKGAGNLLTPWLSVSMRWLIRPLVPDASRLTKPELAPFQGKMLTVDSDEELQNLCLVLGKPLYVGSCATWMARWNLVDAIGRIRGCRARVEALVEKCPGASRKDTLRLYAARLGAYACVAETLRNTIMYQYAVDTSSEPQFGPNMMDYDDNIIYDQRALMLRKTAREELDNIAELIRILESHKGTILETAPSEKEQTVFALSPTIKRDLKRKMKTMMDHWQDYEELYPATKVWDFEPKSRGNTAEESQEN